MKKVRTEFFGKILVATKRKKVFAWILSNDVSLGSTKYKKYYFFLTMNAFMHRVSFKPVSRAKEAHIALQEVEVLLSQVPHPTHSFRPPNPSRSGLGNLAGGTF